MPETAADPKAIAITVAELARDGCFAEIEARFSAQLREAAPAGTLQLGWRQEVGKPGAVIDIGEPLSEPWSADLVRVTVPVTGERGTIAVDMTVDGQGVLHGLRLAPAEVAEWAPPTYAKQRRFQEQDVTLGGGEDAVQGTMTLPRRRGPHPGVVLLSGGGPFDRDETHGPNKPLKDLAWGLASRGVAVIRFDKMTHTYGRPADTMTEEYVPHAVAAVHLLQRQASVDASRVYVLGHSMGGKVAPRVATAEPAVAGLVTMAADAQPMQQAAIRVMRYIASLDPDPTVEAAVESITRQAAMVDSPELSPSTPAERLPFGFPATYWLDLRAYDPVTTAAMLDKPMLILQGGRDYQVTVEDDLARWRDGLGHRSDVTIRVYPADNHLFFPGAGPSTPKDYDAPQHVDPAVIDDIAAWIGAARGTLDRVLSRFKVGKPAW